MDGFFSTIELATAAPAGCSGCGLYKTCLHPKMEPSGDGDKRILIVAEAPGEEEDVRGTQLIGKAGQRLRDTLVKFGISLSRDCRKINSVNCRPLKNRAPTPQEIAACRSMILQEAENHKPHLVILLGQSAITSWFSHRYHDVDGAPALSRVRGIVIPDWEMGCWVLATFHPSYVMRMDYDPVVDLIWRKDLAKAIDFLGVSGPENPDPQRYIRTTSDPVKIGGFLGDIRVRKPTIAVDYETTGLKPHRAGHHVYSMAISVTPTLSISFRCGPDQPGWVHGGDLRGMWRQILQDKTIKKVVHNIGFEWVWSMSYFGVEMQNVEDTRLLVHLEDCRRSYTDLKFQGMLKYGILGYEDSVKPFLEGKLNKAEERFGENAFNCIREAPIGDLLRYNAMDALITRWLYFRQKGIPYA